MRVAFAGHRWSRAVVFGWVAVLLLASTPGEARADCVSEAVASCNEDFPASHWYLISIRGWCYIIRTGMCELEQ